MVVDDRYNPAYFQSTDKFFLWNVLLQKAIIKSLTLKKFKEASVPEMLEVVTGCSYFLTRVDPKDEAAFLRKSLDRGKTLHIVQNGEYFIGENYLGDRVQKLETPSNTLLRLWNPFAPADPLFYRLETACLSNMHIWHLNFFPEYHFSWREVAIHRHEAIIGELMITRRTQAFIRAVCPRLPPKAVLFARLYQQDGETYFLCGKTDSLHKGHCLYEFLFEKGRFLLVFGFKNPKQEHGIIQVRRDMSYGHEDSQASVQYQVNISLHSDKPQALTALRTMAQHKTHLVGLSEQIQPLSEHKFLDHHIRIMLEKRAAKLGKPLEAVADEQWVKFIATLGRRRF